MRRSVYLILVAAAAAVMSLPAWATPGGEGNNTGCNGVGNVNSPCNGGGGGDNGGGGGSNGGGGGNNGGGGGSSGGSGLGGGVGVGVGVGSAASSSNASAGASSSAVVSAKGGTSSSQGGSAVAGGGSATGGNATGGAGGAAEANGGAGGSSIVAVSPVVSAAGGTQSQSTTATGGSQHQTSTASNAGNSQSITVNEAAQPAEVTVKNTPDATAIIASPTAPCRIQGGAGISAPGLGLTLGGSILDEGCNRRETSRHLHNMGLRDAAVQVMCGDDVARAALEATGTKCLVKPPE